MRKLSKKERTELRTKIINDQNKAAEYWEEELKKGGINPTKIEIAAFKCGYSLGLSDITTKWS